MHTEKLKFDPLSSDCGVVVAAVYEDQVTREKFEGIARVLEVVSGLDRPHCEEGEEYIKCRFVTEDPDSEPEVYRWVRAVDVVNVGHLDSAATTLSRIRSRRRNYATNLVAGRARSEDGSRIISNAAARHLIDRPENLLRARPDELREAAECERVFSRTPVTSRICGEDDAQYERRVSAAADADELDELAGALEFRSAEELELLAVRVDSVYSIPEVS